MQGLGLKYKTRIRIIYFLILLIVGICLVYVGALLKVRNFSRGDVHGSDPSSSSSLENSRFSFRENSASAEPHGITNGHNIDKFDILSETGTKIQWPPLMKSFDAATYPVYKTLLSAIEEWNPDQPDPPAHFTETLQHFNYSNPVERAWALEFRQAEVPFKMYDVPEFAATGAKWSNKYLATQFEGAGYSATTETSKDNHFMFWSPKKNSYTKHFHFVPPTKKGKMSWSQWARHAANADALKYNSSAKHYYFMSGSKAGARSKEEKGFIETDLPSFSSNENNFFVFDFDRNKGIQCRFGMRGVIAESHYDGGRNMVVMVRGNKRYIINPPSECKSLGIIRERQHPSFRHSLIDWSDVRQSREHGFDGVKAIDTIVRQGEVLYIPSYWFHYIISLQFSAQCNSRSGSPDGGPGSQAEKFLEECGIYSPMGSGKGAIRKKRRHKRKFLSPSF